MQEAEVFEFIPAHNYVLLSFSITALLANLIKGFVKMFYLLFFCLTVYSNFPKKLNPAGKEEWADNSESQTDYFKHFLKRGECLGLVSVVCAIIRHRPTVLKRIQTEGYLTSGSDIQGYS